MSYYEGLSFFVCLVIVLLVAIVIGALEKPLKWVQPAGIASVCGLCICGKSGGDFVSCTVLHLVEPADPWVF